MNQLITQAIKLSVREVARWCHIRAENQHPKASGSAACSLDPMQMLGARSLRRAIANISQTYRWSIAADTGAQQLAGGARPPSRQRRAGWFVLCSRQRLDRCLKKRERGVAGRGTACSCPTSADLRRLRPTLAVVSVITSVCWDCVSVRATF
jgi:hypothetical protein